MRALVAYIKGNSYGGVFSNQGAELKEWFEDFLLGLKFPHAVDLGPDCNNRRYVAMTFLSAALFRYELNLKERAAVRG